MAGPSREGLLSLIARVCQPTRSCSGNPSRPRVDVLAAAERSLALKSMTADCGKNIEVLQPEGKPPAAECIVGTGKEGSDLIRTAPTFQTPVHSILKPMDALAASVSM